MLFGSAHQLVSLYDVKETTVSQLAFQPTPLCGADPNRVSLIISCTSGGTLIITTLPTGNNQAGLIINAQTPILHLNIHDHPCLVQSAFWGTQPSTGFPATVITISEHPLEGM